MPWTSAGVHLLNPIEHQTVDVEIISGCQNNNNQTTKHITAYNDRALSSQEKLQEFVLELSKIRWNVVGIAEVQRPDVFYLYFGILNLFLHVFPPRCRWLLIFLIV